MASFQESQMSLHPCGNNRPSKVSSSFYQPLSWVNQDEILNLLRAGEAVDRWSLLIVLKLCACLGCTGRLIAGNGFMEFTWNNFTLPYNHQITCTTAVWVWADRWTGTSVFQMEQILREEHLRQQCDEGGFPRVKKPRMMEPLGPIRVWSLEKCSQLQKKKKKKMFAGKIIQNYVSSRLSDLSSMVSFMFVCNTLLCAHQFCASRKDRKRLPTCASV